jgi:VWFA-related protein
MRIAVALVVSALAAASADRPTQIPLFRTGVDVLTMEASVLDRDGKPIADLRAADFAVTIDGAPRRVRDVRFYGHGEIGNAPVVVSAGVPGPLTNTADDGRIVVFVVDRDSIMPGSERGLLIAAGAILDSLGLSDASGVLELPGVSTELTREHSRVRAALLRLTGARPVSMQFRDRNVSWDEALAYERRDARTIAEVIERECPSVTRGAGLSDPCPEDLRIQAAEMLQTGRARTQTVLANLSALARQLAPIRGPKQIVFLSSGFPFGQDLLPLFDQFARQASDAEMVIYAVHLEPTGVDASVRKVTSSAYGGREYADALGTIAAATGGALFRATGSGGTIFDRVRTEIHNFYELAVEMEAADMTGKALAVDVKVARPGAVVRNRRRVLPPSRSATIPASRISELLQQPIDLAQLPVTVSTFTMRGDDPATLRTIIAIEAGTSRNTGPVDWAFSVLNDGNVVATGRQHLDATAGPWTAALSAKLMPGRYRLRAVAVDAADRAGVIDRAVEIGLRGDAQVQFSDLLVGVADAGGRLQPSSRIAKGAALSALVEVISADAGMLEKVRTVIELVPGGSATPVKRFVMGARSGTSASILSNQVEIATADLSPGRYTAIAIPAIGDQPMARISRIFEIVLK